MRRQIEANYNAVHVLQAEWSYLNDPLRLADLTRRHTGLVPTTPGQIGDFASLPLRIEDLPCRLPKCRPSRSRRWSPARRRHSPRRSCR